jgi:hypothetical protein
VGSALQQGPVPKKVTGAHMAPQKEFAILTVAYEFDGAALDEVKVSGGGALLIDLLAAAEGLFFKELGKQAELIGREISKDPELTKAVLHGWICHCLTLSRKRSSLYPHLHLTMSTGLCQNHAALVSYARLVRMGWNDLQDPKPDWVYFRFLDYITQIEAPQCPKLV